MIFMRSLSIVVMSQIKLISTPSWLIYFVLKVQPFFINFFLPKEKVRQLRSESSRLTIEISVSGQKMGQGKLKEAQTKVLAYQYHKFGLSLNLVKRLIIMTRIAYLVFIGHHFSCLKNI